MSDVSNPFLLLIAATFFAAGTVKGVTGMGLPTVAMGVLGGLISPVVAASLLVVPSFITNVWQLLAGPALWPILRRFWPMVLAICVGTGVGAMVLGGVGSAVSTQALGIVLFVYAAYTLVARQLSVPLRWQSVLTPLVGVATGIISGATGVFVVPLVPYLQALGLSRDDLVQAFGLSFTVSTIALAAALRARDALAVDTLGLSLLAVAPALAGMWFGQRLRHRISPAMFKRIFLLFMLFLGAEMALRPIL